MQAHQSMASTPEESASLVGETYDPGTVLAERYRVVRALGEGGMGQVYECVHVEVGRRVALKVLQPWLADHAVGKRLRAEARAASAAGHPNIVEVFDAGRLDDGRPFLAMEYLDGRTLLDFIRACGRLSLHDLIEVGAQVARGLHAAHLAGIIHRDLKPENVMLVERDGTRVVKVVDFGIAFEVTDGKRVTREGMAVGTPQYMAPEQVLGAAGTPSFDIYSLGVLLFEMWTGQTPFEEGTSAEILEAKMQKTVPRVEDWRPDTPAWLAGLLAECFAYAPQERPESALIVAQRLEAGMTSVVVVPSTAPTATMEIPAPRRGGVLWVGLAAGAAAATVAVMWVTRPEPSSMRAGMQLSVPATVQPRTPPEPPVDPEPAPELPPSPEPLEPREEPDPPQKTRPPKVRTPQEPLPDIAADPPTPAVAKPKPKPKPKAPQVNCDGVEKRARQARGKHLWQPVLEEVRKKRCWASAAERTKLHVLALKELGRFESCAKVAAGSRDPEIQSWKRLCEKRAEG